jgi:rifampicin phosphotransferase
MQEVSWFLGTMGYVNFFIANRFILWGRRDRLKFAVLWQRPRREGANSMSHQKQEYDELSLATDTVVPFTALRRDALALVGGKGANLGELTGAGLPVPPGFCITTVAYEMVASEAGLAAILDTYSAGESGDSGRLAEAARNCLLEAVMPPRVAEAIIKAYHVLGVGEPLPVAVRSSATAEDLPFASFAGQQDTYLNIVGSEALLDAVRRCWASLWTDRAVSYRTSLGIDQSSVRLAVVVQRMIESSVSGVLFTANPLTGKRRQAVIDANPGLGEAVVSGATNPDHFVVNTVTGEIVERRIGSKRVIIRGTEGGGTTRIETSDENGEACLSDEQVRALAALGAQVEAHYGAPQDTEWAIDPSGKLWLVQSRPITTLYPLPDNAPDTDDVLRVYFSINVFQGVYRPLTPMGIAVFRLFGSAIAELFNLPPRDPLRGPSIFVEAGGRLFFDVTPALRTAFGRKFLQSAAQIGEARSGALFQQLTTDPRLSLVPTPRWRLIRAIGSFLWKTRTPIYVIQALLWPSITQKRMVQVTTWLQSLNDEAIEASVQNRTDINDSLTALEQRLPRRVKSVFSTIPPVMISGLGSYALSGRLLKDIATRDEMQIVLRGLPHNPTTEMDLQLWTLAQGVQANTVAAQAVRETPPEQLAQQYQEGTLPPTLQQGLAEFLHAYGHRGVAEIDLGLPRWSEDPTHILGVLANYIQLKDPDLAPNVQFYRGAREAEAMVATLTQRARRKGWLRGVLAGFFLKRTRALAGFREMPKFCLVLLLAYIRRNLLSIGQAMEQGGWLENAGDIFFITLSEAHACGQGQAAVPTGEDMHQIVRERRASYDHELQRRHIPRVLLSDGTEPTVTAQVGELAAGTLKGSPASPGTVTAQARVILDPTGARLEPGEVLVAPSTDPGWTPLFLTAGGLVMEMGGVMSHGAVVAREYGIPAVVGVAGATESITTGQKITVDGAAGTVIIEKVN